MTNEAAQPQTDVAARPTAEPPGRGSLRADVLSGYALTACRIAAWAGVSAVVYRRLGEGPFAVLALLRGTITLVGYASLGLGPAMVHLLAEAGRAVPTVGPAAPIAAPPRANTATGTVAGDAPSVLDYEPPPPPPDDHEWFAAEQRVYASGARLARFLFLLSIVATFGYMAAVEVVHVIPQTLLVEARVVVLCFGVGVALRAFSEPMAAVLQVRGHQALDNAGAAASELLWLVFVAVGMPNPTLTSVAQVWLFTSFLLAAGRAVVKQVIAADLPDTRRASAAILMGRLVGFGSALVVASLADFLYAPTDYILINRLLSPLDVATYAPAVQVDAALLLVVGGLAAALFPHAAVAHAAGDVARLRRLYVRGTLAAAAVLAVAAGATLLLADRLFALWLGHDLPATREILPLVLVPTVVGGSGMVGRSILLGMGRVRAFTVSALVAGAANVVLSAAFATVGGLGLRGIVLGTVVVVVARAGVWMPRYVLRTLREEEATLWTARACDPEVSGLPSPNGAAQP